MYCVMVSSSNRSSNFLLKSGRNLFTRPGPEETDDRCEFSRTFKVAAAPAAAAAVLTPRTRRSDDGQRVEEGNHWRHGLDPARWAGLLDHFTSLLRILLGLGPFREAPRVHQDEVTHSERHGRRDFRYQVLFFPTVFRDVGLREPLSRRHNEWKQRCDVLKEGGDNGLAFKLLFVCLVPLATVKIKSLLKFL